MLRSRSWRRLVLGAVAVATAVHGESRANDFKLPDPATGAINGRVALLYWPVLSMGDPAEPKLLPPQGCHVHLIPQDDPTAEHRYACGTWFQPPIGAYNAWLETTDRISPPWSVRYGGAPSEGGLAALVPVHAAGRVAIPENRSLADGEELRILSLDSHRTTGSGRIFERRVRRENARSPVLMPTGRTVVGRFDAKSGDAIALARPTLVEAGRTARIWPEHPSNASDLLVVLRKPGRTEAAKVDTVLSIDDGERRRPADICLDVNRIIGIWYGVDARKVTVSLQAEKMMWPPREMRLVHGRVSTIRDRAERLPKLGVSVTTPDGAMLQEALAVTVRRLADERQLATASIAAGASHHQFDDLPADLHRVALTVGEWQFFRDVDLTAGDAEVVFDLEPITIAGKVFLGDDPVAAELRFHNHGKWVSVRTDDTGAYRATLWNAGYYTIRVGVIGSLREPFTQHFTAIDESGTRDFHLPLTNYTLSVRDEETGAPIVGAQVNVGNVWRDDADVEQSLLDRAITDAAGAMSLPPLRAGRLLLTVTADGYAESHLAENVLPKDRAPHGLTISLRQVRSSQRLRLSSATGEPLAGAEVWAFAEGNFHAPIWQATTAGDGVLDVSDQVQHAIFLIRHPRAASMARPWVGGIDDPVEWRLAAPAPPLITSITRPGGEQARSARMAIWIDGVRFSDAAIAFSTWSSPAADIDGRWIARNLPQSATRLLALPLGSPSSLESHAFDTMATTVPFPWKSPTQVTTIE